MKNTRPNSTAKTHRQAALPAEYARERNSRSGTIGWAARSSQPMNAAVSAAPAISAATISGLAQPMLLARISPQTRPRAAPVASTRPSGSRPAAARAVGVSFSTISGIRIRPIGTFSQKIHGQAIPCATAPPTTGPAATASPVTLVKMPMAQARRCGGNPADSSANASGRTSAPPAPWAALAAISTPAFGASAHAADAAVNKPRPTASMRRRPSRSPRAAPVSSSTAKLSV